LRYKNIIDKNSILIICKKKGISFAFSYKKINNYKDLLNSNNLVYYKYDKDEWYIIHDLSNIDNFINYLNSNKGKNTKNYNVDKLTIPSISKLPACNFIDEFGFEYIIPNGDGHENKKELVPECRHLLRVYPKNIKKDLVYDHDKKCYKLLVDFHTDIRNAIITLNGLFEPYEIVKGSYSKIVYYSSEYDSNGFQVLLDNENQPYRKNNKYDTDCYRLNPYIWSHLEIKSRENKCLKLNDAGWYEFEKEFESGTLLFYNKVLYNYMINPVNSKCIKIMDLSRGNISNFVIEDFNAITLRDTKGIKIWQEKLLGFYNESNNTVYFESSIANSLILYNGIGFSYFLRPSDSSIKLKIPESINQDIDTGIDDNSKIIAINFYSGYIPINNYIVPQGNISELCNIVLRKYKLELENTTKELNKFKKIYENIEEFIYQQEFTITNITYDLELDFKPTIDANFKIFINKKILSTKLWSYTFENNKNILKIDNSVEIKKDDVIKIYYKINGEVSLLYDDYYEYLKPIDKLSPHIFRLSYIPEIGSIRLFINGIEYLAPNYWIYDEDNRYIEWGWIKENGGFNIDDTFDVVAVYDLKYTTNNIINKDYFIEQQSQKGDYVHVGRYN
jgi:hypothetical protein